MLIEVTGYSLKDGVITFFGTDCSELNITRLERLRSDDQPRELEFVFDTHKVSHRKRLVSWLKSQEVTKRNQPATWRVAPRGVIGTITELNWKPRRSW